MRFLLTLFILVTLASCGSKKGTVPVKLKLFQSNITAAGVMNGGVLVMGKSEDGKNSFRFGLTSVPADGISLDLAKTKWEFAAVSWAGDNGPLTGNNRCAYTGFIDLQDATATVSFNLSMLRCSSTFNGRSFAHNDYMEAPTGKFLDFFPVMCMKSILTPANCPYSTNNSDFGSYKVVYRSESNGAVIGALNDLSSNCLQMVAAPRPKIPVTDANTDSPLGATLLFYMGGDCSGLPRVYNFRNGFKDNQDQNFLNATGFISSYYSLLYINPGALHDLAPIEPMGLTVIGGMVDNGATYFNTTTIGYSLPSAPPVGVTSMCVTLEASCTASDWIAPQTSGSVVVSAIDGSKTLRLFFKSATGVVSTTPSMAPFVLDTTAPVGFSMNTVIGNTSTGVSVYWSNGADTNFKRIKLKVCTDATCSNGYEAIYPIITLGPTNYIFAPGTITGYGVSQQYYVVMYVEDKAGNMIAVSSNQFTVI